MKKRIIILTAIVAVIAIACFVVPRAIAETSDPSTTIDGHNLSLEDRINIVYYVTSQDVPSNAEEGVLIWIDEPEIYAYGTEDYKITSFQKSGQYKLFYFNGLAAKQINDEVKAMSYVKVGDDIYCSDIDTYSIATYCFKKMDSTTLGADGVTTLGTVVKDILKYGTVSQKYFGYNTENLAYDVEDHTIDSCFIDSDGHLIINYSTGESVDVGNVRGDPGQSAYELARDMAGFTGTQEEWLQSLKGSDGVGIEDISVNSDGELVFTMSDGSTKSVVLPGTSSADTNSFIFHLLEDGTYGVKAGTAKFYQEVVIPSTYKGLPVTMILDNAFFNSTDIESITIPDSVTSIGNSAFNGCRALTSIEIPASVTSIGNRAFYECRSLTSIEVPNSVTSLGDGLFNECTSLTSISIPDSVTSISNEVFFNCSSLTSIEIPDSVTSIGDWAFSGCTSLTSIEIPDSVTSIGDWVFCNCTSLANIEIPDSVASIGNYAFYSCKSLTNIEIPDSVTSIGDGAFYICTSLTNIEIPDSVASIGNYAFYSCTSLTSIEIPASVTNIGGQAFCNCTSLVNIEIPDSVTSIGDEAFLFCTSLKSIEIPDSVTSIGQQAFRECTSLESITIHNSIEVIGSFAFANCDNLTDIYFYGTPVQWNNIEIIEDNGPISNATIHFIYSEGLAYSDNGDGTCTITGIGTCTDTDPVIPNEIDGLRVICIGGFAFNNCTDLISITIPKSVTTISAFAFGSCPSLNAVYYEGTVDQWEAISLDYWWNSGSPNITVYCSGGIIPEIVRMSRDEIDVFDYNIVYNGLNDPYSWIVLPSNSVGSDLRIWGWLSTTSEILDFGYSINAGEIVTGNFAIEPDQSILDNANSEYASRYEIFVPITAGNYTITVYVMTENTTKVIWTIRVSVGITDVETYALSYYDNGDGTCSMYKIVLFEGTDIILPSEIDGLTVAEISNYLFYQKLDITSVVLPDGVTSIGNESFAYCSSLTEITIPDSVLSIGRYAFSDCINLTDVYYSGTVDQWNSISFGHEWNYNSCGFTVHCADGTVDYAAQEIVDNNRDQITVNGQDVASVGGNSSYTELSLSAGSIGSDLRIWGWVSTRSEILSFGYSINGGEIVTGAFAVEDENVINAAQTDYASRYEVLVPITEGEYTIKVYVITENSTEVIWTISLDVEGGDPSGQYDYSDGLSYVDNGDGTCAINGIGTCTDSDLRIPAMIDGLSVTSIESWAFEHCANLQSVTIPDSVTSICGYAFYYCTSLESVEIPDGVTVIGDYAFYNCFSLADIYFNGTYEQWDDIIIGNYASAIPDTAKLHTTDVFKSEGLAYEDNGDGTCTITGIGSCADTEIYIPGYIDELKVTAIGEKAFENQTALTEIHVPGTVKSIGTRAFYGCTGLTEMRIPRSVTSIGTQIFYKANNIHTVYYNTPYFPSSETENPFLNNTCIKKVVFGNTSVGYYAARNLGLQTHIEEVELKGVKSIGDYAFSGCTSLESVTIGNGVTSIDYGAFSGCTSLESVTIGNSVTGIGEFAFSGCTSLASIMMPDSVTSIGEDAFSCCTSLASIMMPDSVTSIGNYAFRDCTGLESVTIGNSVTGIGEFAFSGCTGLESIDISESVTRIGVGAFHECTSLTTVYYSGDIEDWCRIVLYYSFPIYSSNPCFQGASLYINGELLVNAVIPDSVTSIGNYAFIGCTSLESITIPDSVTSIGQYAFLSCASLESITIPNSVTSIGEMAFFDCPNLTTVYYAGDIEDWCGISFNDYSNPCYNGASLYINGEMLINAIILDSVTSIGDYAFSGCTSLESIEIPNIVTSIGDYVFSGCTSLESIEIPDSVTAIGDYAFSGCTSLESVEIPGSVLDIGYAIFGDCCNLTDVYYGGTINQWYAVFGLDGYQYNFTVHCSNGIISYAEILSFSRDQITLNGEDMAGYGGNGPFTEVVLPANSVGSDLRIWGWVSTLSEIQSFGYSIDGGALITGDYFVEDEVVASMGEYASRYEIFVPIEQGSHIISIYVLTENATCLVWTISVTA